MVIDVSQGLLNAAIFLGIPFVLSIFVAQWQWARTCEKNIQVLVAQSGGGGRYMLAPKEGGEVTIANPATGTTRTWPVNELATIDVPYPGLGFMPRFMQKEIRLAIVNEGDWEPMLNRSPHRKKIMSPDAVEFLQQMAENDPKLKDRIDEFLDGVATGPTREMIADPAVLGALKTSSVMKALATVSDDLLEALKGIRGQLARFVGLNATYVYIGMALILVMNGFIIYRMMQGGGGDLAGLTARVDEISRALGLK